MRILFCAQIGHRAIPLNDLRERGNLAERRTTLSIPLRLYTNAAWSSKIILTPAVLNRKAQNNQKSYRRRSNYDKRRAENDEKRLDQTYHFPSARCGNLAAAGAVLCGSRVSQRL